MIRSSGNGLVEIGRYLVNSVDTGVCSGSDMRERTVSYHFVIVILEYCRRVPPYVCAGNVTYCYEMGEVLFYCIISDIIYLKEKKNYCEIHIKDKK